MLLLPNVSLHSTLGYVKLPFQGVVVDHVPIFALKGQFNDSVGQSGATPDAIIEDANNLRPERAT